MLQLSPAIAQTQALPPPPVLTGEVTSTASGGHHGFTFHDLINIFNPLQHIPVVGTIYREITGDTMEPISTILGGALFGGVVGLAGSAVDAIVEETTGEDIGAHIMATLGLHHDAHAAAPTQTATPPTKPVRTAAKDASGGAKPVPAFLVAEAAADRGARGGGAPGAAGRPTDFWRSLQRGGAGTSHVAPGPMAVGPSGTVKNVRASASTASIGAAPTATAAAPADPIAAAVASPAPEKPLGPTAPVQVGPDGVQPLPRGAIPSMMMDALAKYEAMHKAPQASSVDQIH